LDILASREQAYFTYAVSGEIRLASHGRAPTLPAAIRLYDDVRDSPDQVSVRDMEGREINVEELRPILNEGEPSQVG